MRIAIIGCGNMGSALAERLSETHKLNLYDHHKGKAERLEKAGWGLACHEVDVALSKADLIILAVKPQSLKQAAALFKDSLKETQVVVSILAGTPLDKLKTVLHHAHIVRMMPNLAIIHGVGVIGLSTDEKFKKELKECLVKAFEPLGEVFWLPEDKMDALTSLTGSGPAFFFAMVEAMIDAGIAMGFRAEESRDLVYQMLKGSLALLENGPHHPGELKWQIASPQGTTIAGLRKLEEMAIRGGIINTFLAAFERGKELSLEPKITKKHDFM